MRLIVPYTDDSELAEISDVLASGYLTQGRKVAEFEKQVREFIGCRHAFATSSCTTALHLSLVALGIKAGDEVLVADFTFPATANVVVQQLAIPVLADIRLDTFTLDPADVIRKITPKTKAIIPVDTFGCAADMDPILEIAEERGIPVVEDAACALGATYKGRYCGNLSTVGCFSFHPRKVITTGEGGMTTTNDDALAERIQVLRSHGGVRSGDWYSYETCGFNYRLSDVQGALGIAQMKKLSWILKRRRELAALLTTALSKVAGIRTPVEPEWGGHAYQSFVVLVDRGIDRNLIIQRLKEDGVEATLGTYAVHAQPYFQKAFGYRNAQLPNSYEAFTRSITLPLFPQMDSGQLHKVAEAMSRATDAARHEPRPG